MAELILPDSRLEQPELLYAGRKPAGNVKIDWTHPLTKGLVGYWLFTESLPINLVENKELSAGTTDSYIQRSALISPNIQAATDSVLTHEEINLSIKGASCIVRLRGDSIQNAYGSISCLNSIDAITNGFAIGWQGSNIETHYQRSSGSTTKSFPKPDGVFTISASTTTGNVHELIIGGEIAVLPNTDFWYWGVGLCSSNDYLSTRGDFTGEYYMYAVYNYTLPIESLLSLNRDPYQFLIPAHASSADLSTIRLGSVAVTPTGFKPYFALYSNTILGAGKL